MGKPTLGGGPLNPLGGLREGDVLRAEIHALRTAGKKITEQNQQLVQKLEVHAQILATVIHAHHPGGVELSEADRATCGESCLFRTNVQFEDEGAVRITLVPLTEEERLQIAEAKKREAGGGTIIVPP